MDSPQRRITYLTAGEQPAERRPTLLLIHGSGVSARSWTEQLQDLGRAFRVFAIDLPGHGESDARVEVTVEAYADAARGLIDALGIGPVFAAAHSLGGAVALALAARHPKAVKGLVLLSTCAQLPQADGSFEGVLYRYLPGPIRKVVFFWMAKKVLFAPGARGRAIRLGMEEIRTCRPEVILRDVAAARSMNLEEAARGLRLPTLILCGSRDKLTPPALSERLHEPIPGSRLRIVEGAGHMLPLEAPAAVNQAILDFAGSAAPSAAARSLCIGGAMSRLVARRVLDKVKALFRRG